MIETYLIVAALVGVSIGATTNVSDADIPDALLVVVLWPIFVCLTIGAVLRGLYLYMEERG